MRYLCQGRLHLASGDLGFDGVGASNEERKYRIPSTIDEKKITK